MINNAKHIMATCERSRSRSANRAFGRSVVVAAAAAALLLGVGVYLLFFRTSPLSGSSAPPPPSLEVLPVKPDIEAAARPDVNLSPEQLYDGLIRAINADDYSALREYAKKITPLDRELLAKEPLRSRPSILSVAVRRGSRTLLKEVIESQVAFDHPDSLGRQSIHIAAMEGRVEMLVDLVEYLKVPLDSRIGSSGSTSLHVAASSGRDTVVSKILALSPESPQWLDSASRTPLHVAVEGGQLTVVRTLLACKQTQVNAIDARRQAALHLAAAKGDRDLLEALLAGGADKSLRDKSGQTAAMIASERGDSESEALLR